VNLCGYKSYIDSSSAPEILFQARKKTASLSVTPAGTHASSYRSTISTTCSTENNQHKQNDEAYISNQADRILGILVVKLAAKQYQLRQKSHQQEQILK